MYKHQKRHFLKTLSWADFHLLESFYIYIHLPKNQKNYHRQFLVSWCMLSSHVAWKQILLCKFLAISGHSLPPLLEKSQTGKMPWALLSRRAEAETTQNFPTDCRGDFRMAVKIEADNVQSNQNHVPFYNELCPKSNGSLSSGNDFVTLHLICSKSKNLPMKF